MCVNLEKLFLFCLLFFLVKDIDVLFRHKSVILETVTDTTLLEQGLDAKDHGTERFAEVRNGE